MRNKRDTTGPKVPMKKPAEEMSFEDQVKLFATFRKNPDEFSRRFAELGFTNAKDGCPGNCISCRKKKRCETYKQIRACFNKSTGTDPVP